MQRAPRPGRSTGTPAPSGRRADRGRARRRRAARRGPRGLGLAAAVAATVLAAVAACGGDGGGDGGMAGPGEDGAGAEVRELYQERCSACHGEDGRGASGPSLAGVADRRDRDEIADVVRDGRRGMPAWEGTLTDAEIDAVAAYVEGVVGDEAAAGG